MKEYDKLLTKNTTQIESDRKITKNENMPLKINFEYNKSKSLDKQLQVLNTEPITSNHFKLNDINEKKQNTEVYYNMTDVNQDVNNLERYNKPLTSKIFYKKTSPIIIDNKSDKKTLSRNENEITIISHTKNTTNIENENLLLEEEKKFIVDISEKILLNAAKIKGKAFKPSSNFPCSYFYNEQFYYSLIKFLFPSFHINSANNIYVFEEKQNIFYMIENNDNYCANFNDSLYNLKQTIIFLESLTEISLANINPEKLIKERSYYSIKSLLEFIYDLTQIMLDYDCSALVDNYNVKINDNIESNLIEVNFDHIDHHDSNEVKVFEDSSKGNTFLQSINKNFYDHVGQNSLCFQEDEKSKKFENSKRLNTESNPHNYLFSFGNNHLTNGPNNSSIKEKSSQNEFDNNKNVNKIKKISKSKVEKNIINNININFDRGTNYLFSGCSNMDLNNIDLKNQSNYSEDQLKDFEPIDIKNDINTFIKNTDLFIRYPNLDKSEIIKAISKVIFKLKSIKLKKENEKLKLKPNKILGESTFISKGFLGKCKNDILLSLQKYSALIKNQITLKNKLIYKTNKNCSDFKIIHNFQRSKSSCKNNVPNLFVCDIKYVDELMKTKFNLEKTRVLKLCQDQAEIYTKKVTNLKSNINHKEKMYSNYKKNLKKYSRSKTASKIDLTKKAFEFRMKQASNLNEKIKVKNCVNHIETTYDKKYTALGLNKDRLDQTQTVFNTKNVIKDSNNKQNDRYFQYQSKSKSKSKGKINLAQKFITSKIYDNKIYLKTLKNDDVQTTEASEKRRKNLNIETEFI